MGLVVAPSRKRPLTTSARFGTGVFRRICRPRQRIPLKALWRSHVFSSTSWVLGSRVDASSQ